MSKYKVQIKTATFDRLQLAAMQDKSILADPKNLEGVVGHDEAYLLDLGLTPGDLQRLELRGVARRGYTRNYWRQGDTLPGGKKVVGKNETYRGQGHKVKWIILAG